MRILFISPSVPYPPTDGHSIRTYNVLKRLPKRHDITLLCFADEEKNVKELQSFKKECNGIEICTIPIPNHRVSPYVKNIISTNPTFVSARSMQYQEKVNLLMKLKSFDMIYADGALMSHYCENLNIPKILDARDALSMQMKLQFKFDRNITHKVYLLMQSRKMRRYEKEIYPKFDCVFTVSERDAAILTNENECSNIRCIPYGVDFGYFRPFSPNTEPNSLVFVGMMSYTPNADAVLYFANKIYPLIQKKIPEVKFYVVGRNPPKEITKLNGKNNITVTGFVKDIRPYLNRAAVSVSPIRFATGIQNKILEAMAMAKPIVTTPTAAQGLKYVTEKDILIARDKKDFAEKTIKLLKDETLRRDYGMRARSVVEKWYDWDFIVSEIEKVLEEITH